MSNNRQKEQHVHAIHEFTNSRPFAACPESLTAINHLILRRWESAILQILNGMALYAKCHKLTYKDKIGNDGIFGEVFESMVENMKILFNGEMGRLDGAEMSKILQKFCKTNDLEYPE